MKSLRTIFILFAFLSLSNCKSASIEESNSEEQSVISLLQSLRSIGKFAEFDSKWLSLGSKVKASNDFVTKLMQLAKTNNQEFLKLKFYILKNPAKMGSASTALNLVVGSEADWVSMVRKIGKDGVQDQSLSNHLVPVMMNLDAKTKGALWKEIGNLYPIAYKNKHQSPFGNGMAPKRALDVILRFTLPPEDFFVNVKSQAEARSALNRFIAKQHDDALQGTDFGVYTGDDVLSIAKYVQNFLRARGKDGEEILLKGSLPTGRANLAKRNPLENIVDSVLQGMDTSYSDVDMLVPDSLQKSIQSIAGGSYSALVSSQAKAIVSKTGAKPSFQTHTWPDLFAELDGAFVSPVGIRITKDKIYINLYRSAQKNELPEKNVVDAMSDLEKEQLRSKWVTSIPVD
ncbi:MAG: hypothetical protein WCI18_15320 [Pseudomonadota bacterium]